MRSDGTKKSPVRMLVYLLLLAAVVALGYFTDIVDFTELKAVFSLKLTALLKLAVMVLLVLLVSNLVIFILHGIKPRTHRGGSVLSLLSSLVKYVAGIIIVCQSLSLLGVNVGTIIASVGVLALVVGFSAESLIADVVIGAFMLLENQYNVGDIVEVNGFRGVVTKIGIRTTSITDGGGNVKIINNSEMKNILNRSDNNSWSVSDSSIPYETDLEKLEAQLPALLDAGLDSVNISLDTLRPEVFRQITARDDFAAVQAGLQAALESGLPVKLNCVPQAGVNEGELEALAALAKNNALQVRFIEMMPIGYGAAMPCISGPELRARFARRWPELAPLSPAQEHALGDGPAVYYTVPGWQGSIGFIAAVHGKFCASCNRVRLTSQGFLRPCLASETGCDLRTLLRGGAADEELLQAIRETIWSKPREHHFGDHSMPATRGMYRIGG